MLPFERGFDLLQQRQAREFTGYTTNNQLELDRLLANMSAGVTLTEGEKTRANQLAIAEAGYRNQLEGIRLQGQNQLAGIRESGSQFRESKKAPAGLDQLFGSIFG